jgi:hypothetical protein
MNVTIIPEGREFLAFSYTKPADWLTADIPAEEPNFDDPKYFAPLAAAVSPCGSGAFTVGARMRYSDGTLRDWLGFLCEADNIQIGEIHEFSAGEMRGLRFEARQVVDDAVMRMRNLYVEDGGRLYTICAMAAEGNFLDIAPTLAEMAESFRPVEIQGPTVEQNLDTLDPEHPTNRNLRDNGIGLVPRVVSVNHEENYAVLAAAAVSATFRVPLGWHAIDDGRRTLLFHTQSDVQINLDRRAADDRIFDEIEASYYNSQPDIQSLRLELAGMPSLAFRNFRSGDDIVEQVFLLRESGAAGTVLCARVTSPDGGMGDALETAEIVLSSIQEVAA